jgi:hypothetical protein
LNARQARSPKDTLRSRATENAGGLATREAEGAEASLTSFETELDGLLENAHRRNVDEVTSVATAA